MPRLGGYKRPATPIVYADESWITSAPCRRDPDQWFPEGGHKATKVKKARAQAACRDCPVLAQCARRALDGNEKEGIWAGWDMSVGGAVRVERLAALQRLAATVDRGRVAS